LGDESFRAIDCTDTDNHTITKRKYTKHRITNPNTNKPTQVQTKNAHTIPKTVHL